MYMSPEQLNQSGGDQGYSGTAVDVWASGVLLIVMLVRRPRTFRFVGLRDGRKHSSFRYSPTNLLSPDNES